MKSDVRVVGDLLGEKSIFRGKGDPEGVEVFVVAACGFSFIGTISMLLSIKATSSSGAKRFLFFG